MYKSIFTVALLLMTGLFTLTSCDNKNNTPEPSQGTVKEYTQSRTTDVNGEWVYFSFATGKEVEGVTEANYKERLDCLVIGKSWGTLSQPVEKQVVMTSERESSGSLP